MVLYLLKSNIIRSFRRVTGLMFAKDVRLKISVDSLASVPATLRIHKNLLVVPV